MLKIAILASGTGSNALALIQKAKTLKHIEITVIITDQPRAGVTEHAKDHHIPYFEIPKNRLSKIEHEQKILKTLNKHEIDWIFLAGYMRLLSSDFINVFYSEKLGEAKIVNIHPSLLPKYPGLDAFERAFESQDKESGITLHFVDSGMDTGKIIKQKSFEKFKDDTLEDFKKRGQSIEHEIYPALLEHLDTHQTIKGSL